MYSPYSIIKLSFIEIFLSFPETFSKSSTTECGMWGRVKMANKDKDKTRKYTTVQAYRLEIPVLH